MVYNVGIDEKGGALRMAEYRDRGDRRTGRLEDESNQAGNKDRSRESVRRGNMGSVTRGGQRGNTDRAATGSRGENRARRNGSGSRSQRKRLQRRRMVVSALIEILILVLLAGAFCWNRGLGAKVSGFLGRFDGPPVKELDVTGVNSSNVVLMDVKSGRVIGDLNGEERIYPASMTKIMTAIVALEAFSDLDGEITLSDDIFYALDGQDATQAGFRPGESVRVRDLVYGAMLPSGAECCLALADAVSGSEEAFVQRMNQKAKSIGMKESHFMDCTGLHDLEHYSTTYDIALLLKYALHNDTFRDVIESHFHSTPATNVHPDGITYYSTMFKNMSDTTVTGGEILGGKTGYTSEAGHCLASFAQIYDREYILVTAGAPADATGVPHLLDAKTIYNRLGEAVAAKQG